MSIGKVTKKVPYMTSTKVLTDPFWEIDEEGNLSGRRHTTQFSKDGLSVLPHWPHASHFLDWPFTPDFKYGDQPADLYYWRQPNGDLLIGIQLSEEDGDYVAPFINGTQLESLYARRTDAYAASVIEAYNLACEHFGITPEYYKHEV